MRPVPAFAFLSLLIFAQVPQGFGARPAASVLIRTVKSDKYDRYLADVWVGETYLNQKLIDKGLAVRVSE